MSAGVTVSIIAPPRYLRAFVEQIPPTIHYIAAQRVLQDDSYCTFYLEQADRGAHLVLDNGVFDLGQSLEPHDLLAAARRVRAAEIVLPDVLHDGRATVVASDRAARILHGRNDSIRLCAVIQGMSDDDWLTCYEHFVNSSYVGSIALPSPKLTPNQRCLYADRVRAATYLHNEGLISSRLIYRLLGLGDSGHHELQQQRQLPWIQSVDSSAPVVLGALGIEILRDVAYHKPTVRVEDLASISQSRFALIRANIATVRAAAGCTTRLPLHSHA